MNFHRETSDEDSRKTGGYENGESEDVHLRGGGGKQSVHRASEQILLKAARILSDAMNGRVSPHFTMKPLEENIANDVSDALVIYQIRVENQVAFFVNVTCSADAGVEGVGKFQFLCGNPGRAEDDVAALAEGGEGFHEFGVGRVRIRRSSFRHAEKSAVVGVVFDFFHQFLGGGKPPTVTIVIIFIEVIGDFPNQ